MTIITLTVNPALDKSAKVDQVIPDQKLSCYDIQYQAGGGGINISRVLHTLGVKNTCIYTAGGDTGFQLTKLLKEEQVDTLPIKVQGVTRENLSVVDTHTQLQYRFGMPGQTLTEKEIETITETVLAKAQEPALVILSGSLSDSMPQDLYARLVKLLTDRHIKVVIDTSGKALTETLKEPVFLIKPNRKELAQLAGNTELNKMQQEEFAMDLVQSKQVQYVAVSQGGEGAFLACPLGIFYCKPPEITVKSTIGAGDSMVAGMVYAIQKGMTPQDIIKWGVACGVATTMTEGTNLATQDHINKVLTFLK
ncbi:1-phosphofructokinase family hexose kinase [Formosa sp. S-31]|uniref:1-phosphofructokinase family hexose kinase n=1 Tax=Formosa sp. S-31 TaxID=2790949 RepID=UPI003EC01B4C